MEIKKERLTPMQALQKLQQYCAYQERCHSEAKTKLYNYGLTTNEVDNCITELITENYLNEERFAIAYAGGKFRIKKWGRVKIKYELAKKQVSIYCIKKALLQIDTEQYYTHFEQLYIKRLDAVRKEKNIFAKKKKIRDYLLQHGYESEMINERIKTM